MKAIGILGGIGYKATSYFYERLNYLFELKMGLGNSCPILLQSINFKKINALLPNNANQIAASIKPSVQFLDNQNIACVVLVNNTMHKALDVVLSENKTQIPYCHVGVLITESLKKTPYSKKVLILGTAFTMTDNYLKAFVPKVHNLVIPDMITIKKVDTLRQLFNHHVDFEQAKNCFDYLKKSNSTDTIFIIACTELSIAFANFEKNENWIDTLELQAEKAIDLLLQLQ
ncbi:MAG: aspartate racemase [Flavobacterium sp.]|jgi:aspartate racemase